MRTKNTIFTLCFLLYNLAAYSQVPLVRSLYKVNKQISLQVKKYVPADPGRLKNSMHIRVPWDNNTFFDQSLDCYTKSQLRNDTIYITGHMMGELGYGFQLALFRDSCIVAAFGLSDGPIYKYNESDTQYVSYIPLSTVTQEVVLPVKPSFKEGEIIEGFIKLNSQPFYYTRLKGRFKIELQAYFKTAPLQHAE